MILVFCQVRKNLGKNAFSVISTITHLHKWDAPQLVPFFIHNGLDLSLFWTQLFANRISSTFALDLFVSSVVFWIFIFKEGTRLNIKFPWVYFVCNLTVGLSFALPLFLWVRSRHLETKFTTKAI